MGVIKIPYCILIYNANLRCRRNERRTAAAASGWFTLRTSFTFETEDVDPHQPFGHG